MNGSSWVLVADVSKDGQVAAKRRQVHSGSRCHQLSAGCCSTAGLRCCTLKEKDVDEGQGRELGLEN